MGPRSILHLASDVASWVSTLSDVTRQRGEGRGTDHVNHRDREIERQLVQRIHPTRMKLRVEQIIEQTPSTKSFRLARTDGELPPFRPGQYVNLFVTIDGTRTSRPYSISSKPGDSLLELTVRNQQDGFVSPYLCNKLQTGDMLESTGPVGQFRHEPLIDSENLVLLAGGSGITPLMSMVRDQAAQGFPLRITLLYGSRTADDVIFGLELEKLAAEHDRFDYSLVISEPPSDYEGLTGFLDARCIADQVGSIRDQTFLLCGPNVMLEFCRTALNKLGVPEYQIRTELFGPPDNITSSPGWPAHIQADHEFRVELAGQEQPLLVPAGEPLLNSLERAGIVVPAVCRTGECSACRSKLLAGQVYQPPTAGVREADRTAGYLHPCAAYPTSHLKLRLPTWLASARLETLVSRRSF